MIGQAAFVAEQVDELNNVLPDVVAEGGVIENAELLGVIRGARQRLALCEAYVERICAQTMRVTGERMEWDGGRAEVRHGANRKEWLHDDLAHVVTACSLVDPDTGELPGEDVRHAVERAVSALMNTCAPSYWRVGQLKQLGIEVGDYCKTEPGRTTVEVHLASDESEAA